MDTNFRRPTRISRVGVGFPPHTPWRRSWRRPQRASRAGDGVWEEGFSADPRNPCGPPEVYDCAAFCSSADELDLRPLERRLLNKRAFGVRPTIVHIGPNNLMQPDEVRRYTEWLKFFPHVLLVEPNPSVARALLERLSAWGAARAGLMEVVQAALCIGNTKSASFYRFSESVLKEFPNLDPYHISEGGSLLENKYNTTWSENFGGFKNPGYSQEEWERMLTYVEEIKVKCFTAERLLERNEVRPSDVDVLIVDAEGLDDQIVTAFFALEGFRPAFVMYEKSIVWRMKGVEKGYGALAGVVGMLLERGYSWHDGATVDSYAVARTFT